MTNSRRKGASAEREYYYSRRQKRLELSKGEKPGKTGTIRMHRAVLGYDGDQDVDHINQNSLDNRRENLRVVSRSVNVQNMKTYTFFGNCNECRQSFVKEVKACVMSVLYCSSECKSMAERRRKMEIYTPPKIESRTCGHCATEYKVRESSHAQFCTESCRKKAKRIRQKHIGALPPSALRQ